jgi:hypothetical protein
LISIVKAAKESALIEKQSGAYYKLDLAHKSITIRSKYRRSWYYSKEFIKASQTANKLDN